MKIVTFTIKDMDGTRNESQKKKEKKKRETSFQARKPIIPCDFLKLNPKNRSYNVWLAVNPSSLYHIRNSTLEVSLLAPHIFNSSHTFNK
jgi:hypothetical protein